MANRRFDKGRCQAVKSDQMYIQHRSRSRIGLTQGKLPAKPVAHPSTSKPPGARPYRAKDAARNSWLRGLRRAFTPAFFGLVLFIPWRVGAEQAGAAKDGFGGAMLLDRLGPPGLRFTDFRAPR